MSRCSNSRRRREARRVVVASKSSSYAHAIACADRPEGPHSNMSVRLPLRECTSHHFLTHMPRIQAVKPAGRPAAQKATTLFDEVKRVGLTLPQVEATTRYDGSPVL